MALGGNAAVREDVDDATDFDTLDLNGDSYLDSDEIAEWADDVGSFESWDIDQDSQLDPDDMSRNVFGVWDLDGNGSISQNEWEGSATLSYPNDTDVIVFNDVDFDGDSEIDADEFKERFDFSVLGEAWTSNTFDEEKFKTAYFELYDADNDGKVSESEWTRGSVLFRTPNDA